MPKKISALTPTTNAGRDALIHVVLTPSGTPTDRKETVDDFFKSNTGNHSNLFYASLSAAITAIGATAATLEIPASAAVTSSLTIPSNVTLKVIGTGAFNVSASQTLTINGALLAPLRQIFTGSGTVKFGNRITDAWDIWFGAVRDGSTDDAAAIQKAISAFQTSSKPHAGGNVWVGGSVINSTLTIEKNSVRLISTGWGPSNESPYGGFLKWNGSAGSPMILIQDCWNAGVENLRLIGKSTAKPSAAIEYKRNNAAVTQLNYSYAKRVWIGAFYGYDADDAVQFDAGILFSGTLDGDTNKLEQIVINKCTTGIDIQNGNASDQHFDTLKITSCVTGFKNDAFVTGTNWIFGANDIDIHVLGDKHLLLSHFTTEGSKQFISIGLSGQLRIVEGGFQITSAISSSPAGSGIVIDSTAGNLTLKDSRFQFEPGYSGPNHTLRLMQVGAASAGHTCFDNVVGITDSNITIQQATGLSDRREIRFHRPPSTAFDWGTDDHVWITDNDDYEENRNDFAGLVNVFGGPLRVKQIATPTNVAAARLVGTGATTYSYRVSAVSKTGETLASSAATITNGATLGTNFKNYITWYPVLGADAYKIYGRTSGSELLIGTVYKKDYINPQAAGMVTSFVDDGSVTPSGALPSVNNTASAKVEGTLQLATYTTTQRDALPSPQNGMIIYNSTSGKIEGYAGGAWTALH